MFISQSVAQLLDKRNVNLEIVAHPRTSGAADAAASAHVPLTRTAKAVLLYSADDYVLAVIPANARVDRHALEDLMHEAPLWLADEEDFPYIFRDCALGAVPPVGEAFGIRTAVDDTLLERGDVFFEGGDHEHLIHVSGADFRRLMEAVPHGHFCYEA